MTDAEIIKALECCSHEAYDCDACPLNLKEEELCFIEVRKYALDLINRQKAEIERLQKENNRFADLGKMYSEIKAEAIKEFAERLKNYYIKNRTYDRPNAHTKIGFLFGVIDNLVKEMAGEM